MKYFQAIILYLLVKCETVTCFGFENDKLVAFINLCIDFILEDKFECIIDDLLKEHLTYFINVHVKEIRKSIKAYIVINFRERV